MSMSPPIYVAAYSGYKANERPRRFVLDEEMDVAEIAETTNWQDGTRIR